MTDVLVKQQHMRSLGYCSKGVRLFFKTHDFDYTDFLVNGIPASKLEGTGDVMALAVVEVARGNW